MKIVVFPLQSIRDILPSFSWDDSQEAAGLSCITRTGCCHQNTVKLIWDLQGTGKTKTLGFLLYTLLRMKCRILTCSLTNMSVWKWQPVSWDQLSNYMDMNIMRYGRIWESGDNGDWWSKWASSHISRPSCKQTSGVFWPFRLGSFHGMVAWIYEITFTFAQETKPKINNERANFVISK